jgi:hypothetical protein
MRLLVYTQLCTARINYILSVLLPALGVHEFEIINNEEIYRSYAAPKINYSPAPLTDEEVWIAPAPLLIETDIRKQQIDCFLHNGCTAFFATTSATLPFDIFSASFYLLTRYEEYLPHTQDMYGRYAHENSLAFKNGFLHQPLINIWLQQLKQILVNKFPSITLKSRAFQFIPTYDIDIAFSYKDKGFIRNAGGIAKSVVRGEWSSIGHRLLTIASLATDPFDIYEWLNDLHKKHKLQPVYFYLLAATNKQYDKNILPSSSSYRFLVETQATKNNVGIHPSWQSGENKRLLMQEINSLKGIICKEVTRSRQHYIRMRLPETYRQLISAGITKDYSMGYGSINGFRASYCLPFTWFDLEKNEPTTLTVYPFCYMEANSLYEQHFTPPQAAVELQSYYDSTRDVDGLLITIFHNHLITTQPPHIEWRRLYENFLAKNFGENN